MIPRPFAAFRFGQIPGLDRLAFIEYAISDQPRAKHPHTETLLCRQHAPFPISNASYRGSRYW